jgi:hypothetical protein
MTSTKLSSSVPDIYEHTVLENLLSDFVHDSLEGIHLQEETIYKVNVMIERFFFEKSVGFNGCSLSYLGKTIRGRKHTWNREMLDHPSLENLGIPSEYLPSFCAKLPEADLERSYVREKHEYLTCYEQFFNNQKQAVENYVGRELQKGWVDLAEKVKTCGQRAPLSVVTGNVSLTITTTDKESGALNPAKVHAVNFEIHDQRYA